MPRSNGEARPRASPPGREPWLRLLRPSATSHILPGLLLGPDLGSACDFQSSHCIEQHALLRRDRVVVPSAVGTLLGVAPPQRAQTKTA